MGFDYLEFWSCEDNKKTEQLNQNFKQATKNEIIEKPLLNDCLIIVEGKDTSLNNFRTRERDLKGGFWKREKEILRAIRKAKD